MLIRRYGLSAPTLALAAIGLAATDWGFRQVGDSIFPGGVLDETAHLLTMLLVIWALGRRACQRFMVPALIASVAIDLDHLPGSLGVQWLTADTPRPYTHSLLTIALLLVAAGVVRRRRDVILGIVLGLSVHFFRDLAESHTGVSLLWPFSDRSFTIPHHDYVWAMAVVVTIDTLRCLRSRAAGSRGLLGEPASDP
jgi:membrane-bound metal-dependent hydrolase YbcI (DUF457 family)